MALKHVCRRENHEPTLWNIACDLYVNKVISEEFGLNSPGAVTSIRRYDITFPKEALYCSTIDIDVDYVEDIYNELEEQAKNNGYNDAK